MNDHTITFNPHLTDDEFAELCRSFDGMNLEVEKDGTIRMMTPSDNESSKANAEIARQLGNWWDDHGRGSVFDSNTLFKLPDGSQRGPDAAYIAPERLAAVPREALRGFAPVCPNFVIELRSATDSRSEALRKMRDDWMANGVVLGWLIDPYQRCVHVFAEGTSTSTSASEVHGSGPVAGFVLDLAKVWRAYE